MKQKDAKEVPGSRLSQRGRARQMSVSETTKAEDERKCFYM